MDKNTFSHFENGWLATAGGVTDVSGIPWNAHKDFGGVFLKNIVAGGHTKGLLSCHLVRIEPGCGIGMHSHPQSVELHEVIAGAGICLTQFGEISYGPGTMAVLPENSPHEVRAGEQGLYLFAKFITAGS